MENQIDYLGIVDELKKIYPLGIPHDIVKLICTKIEIQYLQELVKKQNELNGTYCKMNKYVDFVKLHNTFSNN